MDVFLEVGETRGGPMVAAVDSGGALVRLRFGEGEYARPIEEELERDGHRVRPAAGQADRALREVAEYWEGRRRRFEVPLALRGTEWQLACWRALAEIPFGEIRTYGAQAAALGSPRAARAVGRANATNPIPIIVPCHRLVGASGALTGFEGGLHIKRRLIDHERAVCMGT